MKKVYFACSIRGGRNDAEIYSKIVALIKDLGLKVLTEHLTSSKISDKGEHKLQPKFIYERDIKWLKSSDFVIAEVTNPSLGVGYELAIAEHHSKPILALFRPNTNGQLSAMLLGNPKVKVIEYEEVSELEKQIIGFVNSA